MYRRLFLMMAWLFSGVALAQGLATELTAKQALGKRLFFDPMLSSPVGQSCAHCHAPNSGFADPRKGQAVSAGVHPDRFTERNSPSVTYLARVPALHRDEKEDIYLGGLFYDGRANTLEEQIDGPLFSAVEMANTSKNELIERLRSTYQEAFAVVYGNSAFQNTDTAYQQLVEAIAAYERSAELNSYTAKYDYYLAGKVQLTAQELRGLQLFEAEDKGNCAACHPSQPENGQPPLFTDFSYDNLGVPKNLQSEFLSQAKEFNPDGKKYTDIGLAKTINDPKRKGKFKVPTLRNIALTAPYMHNGIFQTLEEVVDFYNTRDVDKKWGVPEVKENVNKEELGNLKLNKQEVADIVAFMQTLTDGYQPAKSD